MLGHHGNCSQRRDAGEPGPGWTGRWRPSVSWSWADFQHFSLLISVDCLRESLLSRDCPEQCLITGMLPECSL